jgi:hypothetical protein
MLLIAAAIDIVIEIANPFGMVEAVNERAADTLQLVAGSFRDSTPGQKAVTVVLIDRKYFDSVGRSGSGSVWPMPVNMLTMGVIRRVLDAGPRALFVDVAFPDAPREIADGSRNTRAEALDSLARGLADLDQGIPIFLGDDLSPGPELDSERDRCGIDFLPTPSIASSRALAAPLVRQLFADRTAQGLEVVDASWPGSGSNYQLAPTLTGAGGNCRTLLEDRKGFVASPALALFAAYTRGCTSKPVPSACGRAEVARLARAVHPGRRPRVDPDGLRPFSLDDRARGELALRWRVALSPSMRDLYRTSRGSDRCVDQFYHSGWYALKNYLIAMFGPVRSRLSDPTRRRCVYIDSISAADLGDSRRFRAPEGGAALDVAGTFLKDRIVLLGVDLPQSSDRFRSPINGEVPGVYMHAVAAENLLTFGDGFPRPSSAWPTWLPTIGLGVVLAAAMAALWQWLCELFSRRLGGWGMHLVAPLAYLAVLFVLGSFLIWLLAETLPLTELAMPLIVLHLILFGGMIKNWEEGLRAVLAGRSGGATPPAAPPADPPPARPARRRRARG